MLACYELTFILVERPEVSAHRRTLVIIS